MKSFDSIRNEVTAIIAYADELKSKATSLRKKLDRLSGPAPSGAKKKGLSEQQAAQVTLKRKARLLINSQTI